MRTVEAHKPSSWIRDWAMYNMAQTSEKAMAIKILSNATDSLEIENIYSGRGRPPVNTSDVIKCMVIKVFNNWSSRRSISDVQLAKGMGLIEDIPHFNIISKYMRSRHISKHLHNLYEALSLPLAEIESIFAADATGFSTFKKHWVEYRLKHRAWKEFKKLHIISGIRTNIITCAEVTDGKSADSPQFEKLVMKTSKSFSVKEICADAGYLSRKNCEAVKSIGAVPYIKPRSNIRRRARGSFAWKQMIDMWNDNRDVFLEHYHKRSNVESTFSAIKRKFLPYLRSKSDEGQYNELLCKVISHNLSTLVNSMFELGVSTRFFKRPAY